MPISFWENKSDWIDIHVEAELEVDLGMLIAKDKIDLFKFVFIWDKI